MAGRRQHYIPRFLQRGFLAEPLQNAERTWLHRRTSEARLVSIRDVGVQEHFYSKLAADGTTTLDDLITASEGEFGADLLAMRLAPTGAALDPNAAARLTTHLTLRTAHVRSLFENGAVQIVDQLSGLVTSPDRMRDYLGVDEAESGGRLAKLLSEALETQTLGAGVPAPLAQRVMAFQLRESFDDFYAACRPAISEALGELGAGLSTMVRDGHNKALMTADTSRWEDYLSLLSWQTQEVVGAVLPDCIALSRGADGAFTPLVLREDEHAELVVVPIAHDRLLVGSRLAAMSITLDAVNRASAACSDSFFISHLASDGLGLSGLIGQRCAQAIDAAVEAAVLDLQLVNGSRTVVAATETVIGETTGPWPSSFSLTCRGFSDSDTVAALGGVMSSIVHEIGRDIPLTRLDGFTFATDYVAALEQLDRGDPALGIEGSPPRKYGDGVAKCVQVVREGESKEHVVLEAGFAIGLLGADEDVRSLSIHMVVSMLSHIAHGTLYGTQFGDLPQGSADCVATRLHGAVSGAPGRYFAARASAFADPKSGERYAELVRRSLGSAHESIRTARLAYRVDNNVSGLLGTALVHISFVLSHAAEWLGHRDGLPSDEPFPGSSLPEDLKSYSLHLWLDLFGRDLKRLYDTDRQVASASVLLLGRHVERLLWTVQICPWPTQDGTLYVSVPMGDDERLLERLAARAPDQ